MALSNFTGCGLCHKKVVILVSISHPQTIYSIVHCAAAAVGTVLRPADRDLLCDLLSVSDFVRHLLQPDYLHLAPPTGFCRLTEFRIPA